MMREPFTAVVVTHNSCKELEALLNSLALLPPPLPTVVVVDTGEDDGSRAVAKQWGAQVIELPENPGFGAACNVGVERSHTAVTVLLNPDTELLDGSLSNLVRLADTRNVLLAPRLIDGSGSTEHSAHPVPGRVSALLPALIHPRVLPKSLRLKFDPWRSQRAITVGWATGACLIAKTSLLKKLGPFNPETFMFFEDMDLCLRASQIGVPTEFHPEVTIKHIGSHSTKNHFGGEPFELLAKRRRAVVLERLGRWSLVLDDAAQVATFAIRAAVKRLLDSGKGSRELAQLKAVIRARKDFNK